MPAAAATRLGFVTWDRDDPTGGNVYNRALVAELRALGVNVRLHRLAGPWPEGDASSHMKLARALRAEPACLVDGIVGCGSPEVVAAAVDSGHSVTVVVHLPISDEVGLEPTQRQRYAALEAKTVQLCFWGAVLEPVVGCGTEPPLRAVRCWGGDSGRDTRARSPGQSGFGTATHSERRITDADQRSTHAGTRVGTADGPSLDR